MEIADDRLLPGHFDRRAVAEHLAAAGGVGFFAPGDPIESERIAGSIRADQKRLGRNVAFRTIVVDEDGVIIHSGPGSRRVAERIGLWPFLYVSVVQQPASEGESDE